MKTLKLNALVLATLVAAGSVAPAFGAAVAARAAGQTALQYGSKAVQAVRTFASANPQAVVATSVAGTLGVGAAAVSKLTHKAPAAVVAPKGYAQAAKDAVTGAAKAVAGKATSAVTTVAGYLPECVGGVITNHAGKTAVATGLALTAGVAYGAYKLRNWLNSEEEVTTPVAKDAAQGGDVKHDGAKQQLNMAIAGAGNIDGLCEVVEKAGRDSKAVRAAFEAASQHKLTNARAVAYKVVAGQKATPQVAPIAKSPEAAKGGDDEDTEEESSWFTLKNAGIATVTAAALATAGYFGYTKFWNVAPAVDAAAKTTVVARAAAVAREVMAA